MKRNFKSRIIILLVCTMLLSTLAGCAGSAKLIEVEDFSQSTYKHITNGGNTSDEVLPYNIDAITGATMTVEGPGVVTSIPLSVREIENKDEGLCRGVYKDSTGKHTYEGLDVYYLLNNMVEGDNGIVLTDKAYKVVFKDSDRFTIAELTIDEITKAHNDGQPVILAYGMGSEDGSVVAPFVFDAESENEHSLGYIEELDNEDGCVRLVFNFGKYGKNKDYKTFTNVAYVYICEETEPGFKHSDNDTAVYASSDYTDYIITFRGDALGYEYDLTVEDLENLVVYNSDGTIKEGGIGYTDYYCLANNAYWYVNEYEGLELYKLLMYLGMDSYEDMGRAKARTTFAKFIAADGRESTESFSVESLSYPDAFGFYTKNSGDLGDGNYVPTAADLVDSGYPVLLAYGVNNYPYTTFKTDDGYLSGLSNGGGPMRIVFGKTQYNHANGSNQVQRVKDIIVGNDVLYNTHTYTDNALHNALSDDTVSIMVTDTQGNVMIDTVMSVSDIENIVYGEGVSAPEKTAASRKDSYEVSNNGTYVTDIYEGIDMEYFLMDVVGLSGTNGKVTFSDGNNKLIISLSDLFATGYNTELQRDGLSSIIAFAKNGAPMVKDNASEGYYENYALNPLLPSDPDQYRVDNCGGPLAVVVPSFTADSPNSSFLGNLKSITIELEPDSYAHLDGEYVQYAENSIRFYGDGLYKEEYVSVSDIESRQRDVQTLDYSILNNKGEHTQQRYRGIAIYDLFTDIGIKSNAGDVTVYCEDGTSQTYSLGRLKKSTYVNYIDETKDNLFAMLAYGQDVNIDIEQNNGTPLTPETGGPIKLIMPQETADEVNSSLCAKNVVAIEVTANEIDTWGHLMSDIYAEFLDYEMVLTVKNDVNEATTQITVGELESLDGLIVRDKYAVLDIGNCEGIDLWKLVQLVAGDVENINNPISVTVYANDGYKNDLLSTFYLDGLEKGVLDANGDRKALIIAYALNGYPLVDSEGHEGYTGMAGNTAGPLRIIAENTQGASVKYFEKLVVTIPGDAPIDLDLSIFEDVKK